MLSKGNFPDFQLLSGRQWGPKTERGHKGAENPHENWNTPNFDEI